ncbi:MAG: hypothetical protein VXW22_06355, partial [Pseudomonadota bacterium]|nr:hypothetical protein [Pseudomonadota bacterium]
DKLGGPQFLHLVHQHVPHHPDAARFARLRIISSELEAPARAGAFSFDLAGETRILEHLENMLGGQHAG